MDQAEAERDQPQSPGDQRAEVVERREHHRGGDRRFDEARGKLRTPSAARLSVIEWATVKAVTTCTTSIQAARRAGSVPAHPVPPPYGRQQEA